MALSVAAYTLVIALIFIIMEDYQPNLDNEFIAFPFFLILLVFSVAYCGVAIFGLPAYLIIQGDKELGLKILFSTLGWIMIFMIIFFVILFFYFR